MLLNPNSPWSKGKIGTQTDLHANIHTHTHMLQLSVWQMEREV